MTEATSFVVRYRVDATTCTVNGYSGKAGDPNWQGLDMPRAEPLTQTTLGLFVCGSEAPEDIHLRVPWCHPDDQTGSPDDFDCLYRIRPKAAPGKKWKGRKVFSVAFERWDGNWFIAIRHPGPAPKPTTPPPAR